MNYQVILLPLTVFYCIVLYLLGCLAIRDYILLVIYYCLFTYRYLNLANPN
jgi:hypothetical protein